MANIERLNAFDERFDHFWERLAERSGRLLAARDRESLEWHFKFALQDDRVRVLVLIENGELAGLM